MNKSKLKILILMFFLGIFQTIQIGSAMLILEFPVVETDKTQYFVNSTIYISANWSIIIDPADDLDIKIILSDYDPKLKPLDISVQDCIDLNTSIQCPIVENSCFFTSFSTNILNTNKSSVFWISLVFLVYQGGVFRELDSFIESISIQVNRYHLEFETSLPENVTIDYPEIYTFSSRIYAIEDDSLICGFIPFQYSVFVDENFSITQNNQTNSQGSLIFHIQTVDINNSGSFNLEITILNTSLFIGKKSSFSLEINLPILAEFESNCSKITSDQSVRFFFKGELGISPNQYLWDFGDGQYSLDKNPIHKYVDVGNFTVKLTIIDSKEHNDTVIKDNFIEVIANYSLLADFIWNASKIIEGQKICFNFIENSEISPVKFIWDFGDGQISFERNPIHTYHFAGNFTIKLEIFDVFQNSDFKIKENIILVDTDKKPISHYTFIMNNDENGIFFRFKFDGIVGNCPITYYWNFGDGCFSNISNVTHRFEGGDVKYNVSLKIIDIDGDYSYFSSIIEVKSKNTLTIISLFIIGCSTGSISVSVYIYKLYRKKRTNIFSLGDLQV